MKIYNDIIIPVLFGLILLAAICRFLIFAFKERTARMLCFAVFFAGLSLLYLVPALPLPVAWREVGRALMFIGLLFGNYLEWRDLVVYLLAHSTGREAFSPIVIAPKTVEDLTQVDAGASLTATKTPVEPR